MLVLLVAELATLTVEPATDFLFAPEGVGLSLEGRTALCALLEFPTRLLLGPLDEGATRTVLFTSEPATGVAELVEPIADWLLVLGPVLLAPIRLLR